MQSDSQEFYQQIKEEARKRKAENRSTNTDRIIELCDELQITLVTLTEYHFRLTKHGRTIDYFPTSGKCTIPGSDKYSKGSPDKCVKEYFDLPELEYEKIELGTFVLVDNEIKKMNYLVAVRENSKLQAEGKQFRWMLKKVLTVNKKGL